jgi:cytochrome c556
MQHKSLIARIAAALGLAVSLIGPQAWADGNATAEPMELRRIMRELGKDMQAVTDGISREDWERIAKTAPKIAEHRQPRFAEKMRILGFAGSNAGRFKRFDEQTHQAAKALEQAARRSDGQAVIASFATLQNSCLACHQDFRKPFVEHFYGQP